VPRVCEGGVSDTDAVHLAARYLGLPPSRIARVVERAEERVPWEVRLWDWIVRDECEDESLNVL
jgi:hypothetical protein